MLPQHDVLMRRRNPDTTQDLVIPVVLTCNTPDELLISNIKTNSAVKREWLKIEPENQLTAIMCGSGPSLAEHLDQIKELQAQGNIVYAMNGAAKFLHENGVFPDFQIIVDARPKNIDLVYPKAGKHLFGSQVDPSLFERVPTAILWHQEIGSITDILPPHDEDYALIGGASAVGNSAICIAYTLGHRKIHCFGYDSSHRGVSGHAFDQPMNAEEPLTTVRFGGREYICSYTMKSQAHKFQYTAKALEGMGCEVKVFGDGLLPAIWNSPKMAEQEKYQMMWDFDQYRHISPGEEVAQVFVDVVKPDSGAKVCDYGCGTGRGGLAISKLIDCDMVMVDFTWNSRDKEAQHFKFVQADLTMPIPVMARHGYCCDVMEHIAPEDVESVIDNILSSCKDCFFQISTIPDVMGAEIGQQLHLTVEPHSWWKEVLSKHGEVLWEEERDIASLFHVRGK